ncbi:hypothetical protein ACYJW8_03365 [Frateuria aurantia]
MKQFVQNVVWMGMLVAGAVQAQTDPLNLDVPQPRTSYGPAGASTAAQPGQYYGDHSNASSDVAASDGHAPVQDGKTHISGSVSTGFYSGSRGMGSGMVNSAQLNISKPVGDSSLINVSIGISKMNSFGGRPGWNGGGY